MNSRLKILRSAVGSMPSMGIIKEFLMADIEVIGIDSSPMSFGLYLLDKGYVIPRGDDPHFMEQFMTIVKKEKPDAILTSVEEEMLTLSKNKSVIENEGCLVLCPDYEYAEKCADKEKTNQVFEELGIPIPKVYDIESSKFPCVIKPRFGRGGSGVTILKNKNHLDMILNEVKHPFIQEYVEGMEYTIDILADKEGNALSIVPRIRLGVESGISIKGRTVYNKEIMEYCSKIVKHLKLFGPSCIQCIEGEGGFKFLEINNRFGGGSIVSIKADNTIIPNIKKLIRGEKPQPSSGFKEDLIMLRNYSEIFLNRDELKI